MAQYTPKRKYTKKPTEAKKIIKKIKKEVVDVVEAVQKAPQAVANDSVSLWQKVKGWLKGIAG